MIIVAFLRLPKNAPDGCSDQGDVSGPNRSISAVTLGKDQTKSPMHGSMIEHDLVIEDPAEWPYIRDNKKKTYSSDDWDIRDINRFYDPPEFQPIITLTEGMESVTSSVVDFDELPCLRGTGVFTPVSRSRTDLFRDDEHSGKPDDSIRMKIFL